MSNHGKYKIRTFKCIGCGLAVSQHATKHKVYCSRACFSKNCVGKPTRGVVIQCEICGKEVYKSQCNLKRKNHFCGLECANKYQRRNKIIFNCKMCSRKFTWPASRLKTNNPIYCSYECRCKDKDRLCEISTLGNMAQYKKCGLNKLEKAGSEILHGLGLKFQEQVPMFKKFIVDVVLLDRKIVIQWDGIYWHSQKKRKSLDRSQDSYLKKCGYKVLRFTDEQVKKEREMVNDNIRRAIQETAAESSSTL